MEELGPVFFDVNAAIKIKELLQKEDRENLENDMKLAPSWIAKELYKLMLNNS
jgi:hypothetical protein